MVCTALEFFSGIGGFKLVASELHIDVLAAYDQSEDANRVYRYNFNTQPRQRNLDSIAAAELPDADLWWLSPPCKPFTRRGKQADLDDPRARALVNLLEILRLKRPRFFVLENVQGFENSRAESLLYATLSSENYRIRKIAACPSKLGVPMLRPRLFYLAARNSDPGCDTAPGASLEQLKLRPIADFIDRNNDDDASLRLDSSLQERYFDSLNIVSADDLQNRAICFTSGYARSMKSSGSFILLRDGSLRRFAPGEILNLLGFPESFRFPPGMALDCAMRLAGNSLDLRSVRVALNSVCALEYQS